MADIVDNGVLKGDLNLIISVGVKMILTVLTGGFCGIMCGAFAHFCDSELWQRFAKRLVL